MNHLKNYKAYLKLRNLAPRTISQYYKILSDFIKHNPEPINARSNDIIKFALTKNASRSRQQVIGALKHFYIGVLNKPQTFKFIPNVKRQEFIPEILTKKEALMLIGSIQNKKHQAIIALIYYGALRISEALNLKIENINHNHTIRIVQGKGRKDRIIPLPLACIEILRTYFMSYKPTVYLFNSYKKGTQYSPMSVKKVLEINLQKNNIIKKIRVHDLRHSRATHLLDAGVSIEHLRLFLGHKKISTTQRYIHTSVSGLQNAIEKADNF